MSTARARNSDSLRASLHRRYGQAEGETIYLRMRAEASGPFANTLHHEHVEWAEGAGVRPLGMKKPRASLPGASPFEVD